MDHRRRRTDEHASYHSVPASTAPRSLGSLLDAYEDDVDVDDETDAPLTLPSVVPTAAPPRQGTAPAAAPQPRKPDGFSRPRDAADSASMTLVHKLDDESVADANLKTLEDGYDELMAKNALHHRQKQQRNNHAHSGSQNSRRQQKEDALVLDAVVARIKQKCDENDTSKEIRYVRDPAEQAIADMYAADVRARRNPKVTTLEPGKTFVGREHLNYETLPIGLLDLLATALAKKPAAMRLELFYYIVRYKQRLLLTEPQHQTEDRESMSKFESMTRPFISTQATLHAWRHGLIGLWTRCLMSNLDFLVETQGTVRPIPPAPLLLKELCGPQKTLFFDVYRLDDNFYVFCFFSCARAAFAQEQTSTTTPAGPLVPPLNTTCEYLGFLYGQSDQSQQADHAIRLSATRMEDQSRDRLPGAPPAPVPAAAATATDFDDDDDDDDDDVEDGF